MCDPRIRYNSTEIFSEFVSGDWILRVCEHWNSGTMDGEFTVAFCPLNEDIEDAPLLDIDEAKSLMNGLRAAIADADTAIPAAAPEDAEFDFKPEEHGVHRFL